MALDRFTDWFFNATYTPFQFAGMLGCVAAAQSFLWFCFGNHKGGR
jgi:hypothetical protein